MSGMTWDHFWAEIQAGLNAGTLWDPDFEISTEYIDSGMQSEKRRNASENCLIW